MWVQTGRSWARRSEGFIGACVSPLSKGGLDEALDLVRAFKFRNAVRADTQARIEFEVTHPFHPWRGQRFVLSTRKQNWGEDRVMFYDAEGRLRSLLASWTDVAEPDVFIQVAAGRSFVRPDDLATLATLIEQIERSHGG